LCKIAKEQKTDDNTTKEYTQIFGYFCEINQNNPEKTILPAKIIEKTTLNSDKASRKMIKIKYKKNALAILLEILRSSVFCVGTYSGVYLICSFRNVFPPFYIFNAR
jgi:hypothetical protein